MKTNINLKSQRSFLMAVACVLMLASCSSKQEKIEISDAVKINFDSVFNVMLNDTFYFPRVFGNLIVRFDEDACQDEIRYIKKRCGLFKKLKECSRYYGNSNYDEYAISNKQLVDFEAFHLKGIDDIISMGDNKLKSDRQIELRFLIPRIFAKINGDFYLVVDYVYRDLFTKLGLRFNSYRDFYNSYNRSGLIYERGCMNWDFEFYEKDISLNYPIIFKWDKEKQTWELRNTKEQFENDINALGFREIPLD